MAKPARIVLVRHGESVGNVDKSVYEHTPDWQIPLTDKGLEQARRAGRRIVPIINRSYRVAGDFGACDGRSKAIFYTSPWRRARQTCSTVMEILTMEARLGTCKVYEDPRLREQEWGNYQTVPRLKKIWRERDDFGKFFYRMPDGESGADVYDRVSTFLETLHRDFQQGDYPDVCVIVTHGLTMRVLLMRWFHWSVEEYDALRNPPNGGVIVMCLGPEGRYYLETELRKRKLPYERG